MSAKTTSKRRSFGWILPLLLFFFVSFPIFAQNKDIVRYDQLLQHDNRIHVSLFHERTIGFADVQYYGVLIKNLTGDELRVDLEYSLTFTCGATKTYRIGFGSGLTIKPYEKIGGEGFFETDNTTKDIGNESLSLCKGKPNPFNTLPDGKKTVIKSVSYRLISVKNLTTEKQIKDLIYSGNSKVNNKEFDAAIADYEEALKLDPSNSEAKEKLNSARAKKKEYEEKQALETKKKEAQQLIDSGDQKVAKEDFDGALSDYNKALQITPDNASIKSKIDSVKAKQEQKKIAEVKKKEEEKKAEEAKKSKEQEDQQAKQKQEEEAAKAKAQEEAEKKAAQEEAERKAKAEEEERKRQEELARQQRQQQYYDQQNQATSDNEVAAASILIQAIAVHVLLGNLIYSGLEDDTYGQIYDNASWCWGVKFGYGISAHPLSVVETEEDYDGNTYSYDISNTTASVATIDLGGGMEFWFLRSKHFDAGAQMYVAAGHGIDIQSVKLQSEWGINLSFGAAQMQFFSDLNFGYRTMVKNNWINTRIDKVGSLNYNYRRLFAGFRFSSARSSYERQLRWKIGPVIERPTFYTPQLSNTTLAGFAKGLRTELDMDNRFHFFLEFFPRYQAMGYNDLDPIYVTKPMDNAQMNIGFWRRIDTYGSGPSAKSPNAKHSKKRNFLSISPVNIFLNWYRTETANQVGNYGISAGPSLEYDLKVYKEIPFTIGMGLRINDGSNFRTADTTNYRMMRLDIPFGTRICISELDDNSRFWIAPKLTFSKLFGSYGMAGSMISPTLSAGVDYPFTNKMSGRVALSYSQTNATIITHNNNHYGLRSFGVQAALLF